MKIGHLFLSIFEIKKKVLKTKNFPFSPSLQNIPVKWRAFVLDYSIKNKLQKDPRKVQFLFSNDQKLILHFSGIF
jgi:hypothetical protein